MNAEGRPTRPRAASAAGRASFTGNRGLDIEEALIFETGRVTPRASTSRRRRRLPPGSGPMGARRSAGPHRARGGPALRAALAQQLLDRRRNLPARLVHDEAQSAPQREGRPVAGICRRAPAAAGFDRAGGARRHRGAGARAPDDDGHDSGRHVAEGRRARRALRHDGDQGGARGARRGGDAARRAGAGLGARHQPGDRRAARLLGALGAGGRDGIVPRTVAALAPMLRRSC